MRILILDNYDSFTYNLVHYVNELINEEVDVFRNDKIPLGEIDKYSHILLSPGPGVPEEAGILKDLIRAYGKTKSIFGVCLGMQAIGEVYGAELINLERVFHGLSLPVNIIVGDELTFKNIPKRINVGRYHSWVVHTENFPAGLEVTARDDENRIMALRHREYDVRGVQFHPESILTEYGMRMMENWLFSTSPSTTLRDRTSN
jgi:anthranilate synthase component 2